VLLATKAGTKQEACRRVLHKLINLPLSGTTLTTTASTWLVQWGDKKGSAFLSCLFLLFCNCQTAAVSVICSQTDIYHTNTTFTTRISSVVPDLLTLLRTAKRIFMPNTLCIYGIVYISNVFLVHNGSDESTENTFPPLCSQHFTVSKDFTFSLSTSINVTYNQSRTSQQSCHTSATYCHFHRSIH